MRHHRSASHRCGTCLRFSAAGAARSRSPLSPRHLSPRCYDRSRSRARLSFHIPPPRHPTSRFARVRSRSRLLLYIVPVQSSEPSPEPLGGCRCALCRGNNRSVLFLRSAALTLRSLLLIQASCLSAQGITARLAAFLHTPALCADRRTERQARLAFSRSAGLVTGAHCVTAPLPSCVYCYPLKIQPLSSLAPRSAAATARKASRHLHPAAVTPRSFSDSSAPGCVNALMRIITARVLPGCGYHSSLQTGAADNSSPRYSMLICPEYAR